MNLSEVIEKIETLPEEAAVLAERINGEYRADSEVVLIEMTDEELQRSVIEIANQKAPGKEYFLEVFIIKEVLEGRRSYYTNKKTAPKIGAL